MRSALLIAGKDLRRRLRDRSAYIVGIIAPLGLAAIFSFVFNPISNSSYTGTFGVVNDDGGQIAAMFVDQVLGGLAESQEGVTIVSVDSEVDARARVETAGDPASNAANGLSAAFVIPKGFSSAVQSGQKTTLDVIGSSIDSTSAAIATAVAEGFADEVSAVNLEVRTYAASGGVVGPSTVTDAAAYPSPITVGDLPAETRRLDDTTAMTVGMAIMFLFFVAQEGVIGLLEERRDGTLARLLAAPISKASILGGKAIASYALGIASMTVLVVASTLLLHAHWGNPVGVAILVLTATFAAVGIMAVVSGFAKTDEQANTYTAIVAIALAIFGGSFFPVSLAGGVVQFLSKFTPHAWFIRGLGDLASGEIAAVVPSALVLIAIGVASSALAVVVVRKVVDQ
jgi:ABC-2 type transport system permease protein